jgi:cytochrome c oxidase subunit 3
MPTTLPPPEIRRPDRHDLGENDNGGGRRPPTDKRTGGNGDGDGDNWNSRPQGRRGPRERLRSARIGLFLSLCGVYIFFVAIVSAFFVSKVSGHFDAYNRYINEWLPITLPSILWLNTAALVVSSATGEVARRAMFQEQDAMEEWIGLGRPLSRKASIWLSITLFFGMLFLAGQAMAWEQLSSQHIYLQHSPSSHYFYLLTGVHALHLLVGVGVLVAALIVLQRSKAMATRQIWTDCAVWYWHAMGLLWVMLFLLLEFCQ